MSLEQTITYIVTPVRRLADPLVQVVTGFAASPRIQRTVIRSFFSVTATVSLIAIAIWSYFIFYWLYVPELSVNNPVWFQYPINHHLSPAEQNWLPRASIDLTQGGRYSTSLHDDQLYSAVLELDVPSSEKNLEIGNFMVTLELKNSNVTVHYSSRPAIVHYRSSLLHTLSTFYRAIPLLLGFTDESQHLKVGLIEGFVGDYRNPITTAEVGLSNPKLQIYSARLILHAHLSGLRYFMYYWPITTATSFIASFLLWEIVFAVSAWRIVGRIYPNHIEAIQRTFSDKDETETVTAIAEGEEQGDGEIDEGEETEVPGYDDESVPPTPTTVASFAGPSTTSAKDGGFDTETETEASMSIYGDDEDTETDAEGFQEVPGA